MAFYKLNLQKLNYSPAMWLPNEMYRAEYLKTPGKMVVRGKCQGPGGQSHMSTHRKAKVPFI